jgi:hypothetical protein
MIHSHLRPHLRVVAMPKPAVEILVVCLLVKVVYLLVMVEYLLVNTNAFLNPLHLFYSVLDWLQEEFILSSGARKAGSGYRVIDPFDRAKTRPFKVE